MNRNRFWATVSRALAVVMVTLIAILLWAPGAWASSKYKVLYKFAGGADGAYPYANLTFDASGNIYGTAMSGGNPGCPVWDNGCGVVFELVANPDGSWTYKLLHSFNGGDGGNPGSDLIFDEAGALYGTTLFGGVYGNGTVFKLSSNPDGSWTENVLHSFTGGDDGAIPEAGLISDASGNLYSTAYAGGSYGWGVVFQLTPNLDGTWTETVLHQFKKGRDGATPTGSGLVFDKSGNLYGTTMDGGGKGDCYDGPGCGTVFQLMPNQDGTWTDKVLHRFTGSRDGGNPEASLILDEAGSLYGTNTWGGADGRGNVFKLTPNQDGSWTEKVLHQFTAGKDGANPLAGLVFDGTGSLYGTTYSAGTYEYGVVFKLTLGKDGKWREKVLHTFAGKPGAYPEGGLIFDQAGNLYGTARAGLGTSFGAVYEITP